MFTNVLEVVLPPSSEQERELNMKSGMDIVKGMAGTGAMSKHQNLSPYLYHLSTIFYPEDGGSTFP
jgi:hypothetical protein